MSGSIWIWIILAVYTIVIVAFGFWTRRWVDDDGDFMVAGRGLSVTLQSIGMTSIIVAGTTAATVGAIAYSLGYVAHWWVTGWIIAVIIGAFTIAPFARRTGGVTLTEWLEGNFGGSVRIIAGAALALGLLFSPLANILGGSLIVSGLLGVPPETSVIIVGLVSVAYIVLGGLWATVLSDLIQFILFALALVGGTLWMIFANDGFGLMSRELPSSYFNLMPHGSFHGLDWTAGSAFGLFFLMFCLTFGGTYWHRGAAARSPREATRGWLGGVLLAVPFAVVMPLGGMYVRASGVTLEDPQQAFGVFIAEMPVLAGAGMLAGVLAATMSTAVVGVVAGVSVLFRDVVERGSRRRFSPQASVKWIRGMTLAYGLLAVVGGIVLNRAAPGVGALVGLAFLAAFSAGLLPSVFASMIGPVACRKEACLASILGASAYTVYSLLSGSYQEVHPMFVSFLIATVIYVVMLPVVKLTGPWWGRRSPEVSPAQ